MVRVAILVIMLGTSVAAAEMIDDNDQTLTIDCAKTKTVMVTGNNATLTLVGTCESVDVSGNDAKVKGSVTGVRVSGNSGVFELDAVDSIMVSGNDNKFTYKKAIKKKTTGVLNSGDRNKISKAK